MNRLVMVHGACWGAGQSTLSRRLAASIPDVDVLWEDERSQPAILTRPEFADVADRFRRRVHPPAQALEEAYARLVDTALARAGDAVTLLAWSVLDLAEDLDWARADERALHDHAAAVHRLMDPLDPVLVHLGCQFPTAMARAVAQRGRHWFARAYGDGEEAWDGLAARLLADAEVAAGRVERAFEAGGWLPAVDVDATDLDAHEVFAVVAGELTARGIAVETGKGG